jgi:hypothetical protein
MELCTKLLALATLSLGNNPGIHFMGGGMGSRASLDILEKRHGSLYIVATIFSCK